MTTDWMLKEGALAGRTILVTGGGTGLGRSMAGCFAELGANVVICGRRVEVAQATASELAQVSGHDVLGLACDVRDPLQVDALYAAAEERFGAVTTLVNNAAGNFICPTERLTHNGFNVIVDIVLRGAFNCTLAAGKRWMARKVGGTVLNIITTYAWTGSGYVVPSAMAKAGVLAMTRSLAVEWGPRGIRVNAIAPGPFPTEGAWSRLMPEPVRHLRDHERDIPLGRVGRHEELANLAAFLVSDFAGYINGECVTIDGGQWLRGAGQFNHLAALSEEEWDRLQAARKRGL